MAALERRQVVAASGSGLNDLGGAQPYSQQACLALGALFSTDTVVAISYPPYNLQMLVPSSFEGIERMVHDKSQENIHPDYKRSGAMTSAASDEIAKDVSAFANSDGGFSFTEWRRSIIFRPESTIPTAATQMFFNNCWEWIMRWPLRSSRTSVEHGTLEGLKIFRELIVFRTDSISMYPERSTGRFLSAVQCSFPGTRRALLEAFRVVFDVLTDYGIEGEIWLDGSFIAQKINPNDIDFILVLRSTFYDSSTAQQRDAIEVLADGDLWSEPFQCDTNYVIVDDTRDHSASQPLAYWKSRFGRSRVKRTPKGILVIRL